MSLPTASQSLDLTAVKKSWHSSVIYTEMPASWKVGGWCWKWVATRFRGLFLLCPFHEAFYYYFADEDPMLLFVVWAPVIFPDRFLSSSRTSGIENWLWSTVRIPLTGSGETGLCSVPNWLCVFSYLCLTSPPQHLHIFFQNSIHT